MGKTIAIFAHFDVDATLDPTTIDVLNCLADVCDQIHLITTSPVDTESYILPEVVKVSRRPNVGYDFYSYKVGLIEAIEYNDVDRVFLVNSSFVIVDQSRFRQSLQDMIRLLEQSDAVGSTESSQISWHLQSYLLLLSGDILRSGWFIDFVNSIQPLNNKIDLIMNYEIGLSRLISERGFKTSVVHTPPTPLSSGSTERKSNPVHIHAEDVAESLGLVKVEVLRNNQHQIDTSFVSKLAEPKQQAAIDAYLERQSSHYAVDQANLSSLNTHIIGPPSYRLVRWPTEKSKASRIAVVAHLYYIDVAEEFCELLKHIIEPFDVFITTPFESDVPKLINEFSKVSERVNIAVCENRGRDIGPFISLLRDSELDTYEAVLKIHSKKSKYSDNGELWRKELLQALVGTSYKVLRSIELLRSEDTGIVGPHPNYLTHERFWGSNRSKVEQLMVSSGCITADTNIDLGFFAGSMFWFRPDALDALRSFSAAELDFEDEDGQQDGTLAHALERCFSSFARCRGFKSTSFYLDGVEIHGAASRTNIVPVL